MRAIIPAVLIGFAVPPTAAGDVTVDKDKKSVAIDATVAPRKLEHLKETYSIEVIACWPHPKGKKAHETVVTIEAKPSEVHKALEQIGLKPGKPTFGDAKEAAEGPELNVYIEVPGEDGKPKRLTMDKVLLDPKTNKPLPKGVRFRFTGSVMSQPDPTKQDKVYGADLSGTLIALYPVTNETVVQTSLTMKDEKYLKLDTNKAALPKEGTAVKLILEAAGK